MQARQGTHHHVEAAEKLDGLVDRGLDLGLLADVRFERDGLHVRVALLDELCGLLDGIELDVDEEDMSTLLRE